jgi:prepilin-type N-terminal cleavage/methylation domain-containing protein
MTVSSASKLLHRSARSIRLGVACGFTLIELLVVIGIVAVLAAIAFPAFGTMIANNKQTAAINALYNTLNYARNTALTLGTPVKVCPFASVGSTTCGTAWSSGLIVLSAPLSGTATLLKVYQPAASGPTIRTVTVAGVTPAAVTFDTHGVTTTAARFQSCDARGSNFARTTQVLPTGFVQLGVTPGTAVWGGSITCP